MLPAVRVILYPFTKIDMKFRRDKFQATPNRMAMLFPRLIAENFDCKLSKAASKAITLNHMLL
ncbi:MAG: hypothetical protein J7L03_03180 [Caldisericaceae bacterium]|nr:hypothetical protein [Caldisericaceae bacterium]